ncbi:hypothetical protein Salat_0079900 [Sesamum alatum]|uniref:Uncharacterized protein n=1 Tax=Sesamum alatum TaxID=300844 RepID=A0AAE1YVE4_9LAMI|nr:hypothetical protein Salat_0079900 [Sesamum alatum]
MTQALQNKNQLASRIEPPMDDKEDTLVDSTTTKPDSKSAAPADPAEGDKMQVETEESLVNSTIYKPGIDTEGNQGDNLGLLTQDGRNKQVSPNNRITKRHLTTVTITEVHQSIKTKGMEGNACKSSCEQQLKTKTETENGSNSPERRSFHKSQQPQPRTLSQQCTYTKHYHNSEPSSGNSCEHCYAQQCPHSTSTFCTIPSSQPKHPPDSFQEPH